MYIVLTGSVAFDYLMTFPGYFKDHILPDKLDSISLSFLVDSFRKRRGGIAPNIAYTLALLGEQAHIMATVGEDFEEYRRWLESKGVDTTRMIVIPGSSDGLLLLQHRPLEQPDCQLLPWRHGLFYRDHI